MSAPARRVAVAFVLALPQAAQAQPPAITPRGVVNSASLIPPSLGGGKLAPGATIVIPGRRIVDPNSPTTVLLEHGDWHVSVKPVSILEDKVEAQLPADTPLGDLRISLANGEGSSRAEQTEVVSSSPGIFTVNRKGWGPAIEGPANPGKKITIRVNGLNEAHPKVLVAGTPAKVTGVRGQDVTFVVPRAAARGCWTPVWIESKSGSVSNFVTISIQDRGDCNQLEGWPARPVRSEARTGLIALERIRGSIDFPVGKSSPFSLDAGEGVFFRATAGDLMAIQALPPAGSCTSYTSTFSLVGGGSPSGSTPALPSIGNLFGGYGTPLDAGRSLTIEGGESRKAVLKAGTPGGFAGLLGGSLPVFGTPGAPLFFAPGSYRLRSDGAGDIGKLETVLEIPQAFEWVNPSSLNQVDRSAGALVEWRDLGDDRQMVLAAVSLDSQTTAMGACVCVAPPQATAMRIPPYALANLPATAPGGIIPLRFVTLMSVPRTSGQIAWSGLDDARAVFLDIQVRNVIFR